MRRAGRARRRPGPSEAGKPGPGRRGAAAKVVEGLRPRRGGGEGPKPGWMAPLADACPGMGWRRLRACALRRLWDGAAASHSPGRAPGGRGRGGVGGREGGAAAEARAAPILGECESAGEVPCATKMSRAPRSSSFVRVRSSNSCDPVLPHPFKNTAVDMRRVQPVTGRPMSHRRELVKSRRKQPTTFAVIRGPATEPAAHARAPTRRRPGRARAHTDGAAGAGGRCAAHACGLWRGPRGGTAWS
jgi:hypothetical protein